eukprot:8482042-Karenia_brevis.AAC.1
MLTLSSCSNNPQWENLTWTRRQSMNLSTNLWLLAVVVTTCGVPSSSVLSKFRNSRFNGFSWNAQAVLNKDVGVRRHKTNFLLHK